MDIPDTPGCVCGRGGRAEQRQGNGGLWFPESEGATPSSLSTSFLTKNKPFPIRGMKTKLFFSSGGMRPSIVILKLQKFSRNAGTQYGMYNCNFVLASYQVLKYNEGQ